MPLPANAPPDRKPPIGADRARFTARHTGTPDTPHES